MSSTGSSTRSQTGTRKRVDAEAGDEVMQTDYLSLAKRMQSDASECTPASSPRHAVTTSTPASRSSSRAVARVSGDTAEVSRSMTRTEIPASAASSADAFTQ